MAPLCGWFEPSFLPAGTGTGPFACPAATTCQGLNLVVAAIILRNTLELARAIEELQNEGAEMTAEQLRHLVVAYLRMTALSRL